MLGPPAFARVSGLAIHTFVYASRSAPHTVSAADRRTSCGAGRGDGRHAWPAAAGDCSDSVRHGLTAGALCPSIVSLNTNKSSSPSAPSLREGVEGLGIGLVRISGDLGEENLQ